MRVRLHAPRANQLPRRAEPVVAKRFSETRLLAPGAHRPGPIAGELSTSLPTRACRAGGNPGRDRGAQSRDLTGVPILRWSGAEEVGDATLHRGVGAAEGAAQFHHVASSAGVFTDQQPARHQQFGRECAGLLLDVAHDPGALAALVDGRAPAEQRLLAGGAVHHPVPELVADGEAPPRWPLAGLVGVDPDLAAGGEQQAGERLAGRERGSAGGGGHVVDVAYVQAVAAVDDVLDRNREALAVPDIGGDAREDALGGGDDVAGDGGHRGSSGPAPVNSLSISSRSPAGGAGAGAVGASSCSSGSGVPIRANAPPAWGS